METRKVTIDYSREGLGIQEIEAQVLHHLHDVDGSQIILLKTARRESVENFIYNEVVSTENLKNKREMKSFYDPKELVSKYDQYAEYLVEEKKDGEFHIGQCYDEEPVQTLYCKHCGGSEFKVGQGSYFTAIKCKKCEYEVCIHDG